MEDSAPFARIETLWKLQGVHSVTEKVLSRSKENPQEEPIPLYWKRMVIKDLPQRLEWKMKRDTRSYRSETLYYKNLSKLLQGEGVPVIPKCVFLFEEYDESDPINSKFLLITEDLSTKGFAQRHIKISDLDTKLVLEKIAAFHSCYHEIVDQLDDVQVGTYWTLDKRPADEMDTLVSDWKSLCGKFAVVDERYNQSAISSLGERLLKFTPWVQKEMEKIASRRETMTYIHGDLKSANLFFNTKEGETSDKMALIDFQWSGRGQCMSDVMYLLLGANNAGFGQSQRQIQFIQHYVDSLKSQNSKIKYPLELATRDFYVMTLDFSRIVLSYFFKGATPESITKCASDPGELTHTGSLDLMIDYLFFVDYLLSLLEKNDPLIIGSA